MPNDADYDTLQALYEIKRREINRLEKELTECKMQAETTIENLHDKLLIKESEGQRTLMEYQRQCGNNIKMLKL